jgi:hypothetical protein
LLDQIPCHEVEHEEITLPERGFDPNDERETVPRSLHVPERY